MKSRALALGLAAFLAAGPLAYAEEAAKEMPLTAGALAAENLPALPEGLDGGIDFQSLGQSYGILSALKMPRGASLSVHPLPVLPADAAGVLTMEGRKYTGAALALGVELSGKEADETFGGMFMPGGYTPEAGEKMLHFNMSLLKTEGALNEFFLRVAKGTRSAIGEPLPYDFLLLDMVHVEQLHRVMNSPKTYSFAMRPYLAVDGFAVPLYLRGFASKSEAGYRFLLFVTLDSFREQLDQVTYQIIHKK